MMDVFADVQINEETCRALMDGGSELAGQGDDGAILLFRLALMWYERAEDQDGQIQALLYCSGVALDNERNVQADEFLRRAEKLVALTTDADLAKIVREARGEICEQNARVASRYEEVCGWL